MSTEQKKYVSLDGLTSYDALIKHEITKQVEEKSQVQIIEWEDDD